MMFRHSEQNDNSKFKHINVKFSTSDNADDTDNCYQFCEAKHHLCYQSHLMLKENINDKKPLRLCALAE